MGGRGSSPVRAPACAVRDVDEPLVACEGAARGNAAAPRESSCADAAPPDARPVVEWRRSKGSEGHEEGLCKRCAFYSKGRCQNGDDCTHCHLDHEHRRTRRTRRRGERSTALVEMSMAEPQALLSTLPAYQGMSEVSAETKAPEPEDAAETRGCLYGSSPVLPLGMQIDETLAFGDATPIAAQPPLGTPVAELPPAPAVHESAHDAKALAFSTLFGDANKRPRCLKSEACRRKECTAISNEFRIEKHVSCPAESSSATDSDLDARHQKKDGVSNDDEISTEEDDAAPQESSSSTDSDADVKSQGKEEDEENEEVKDDKEDEVHEEDEVVEDAHQRREETQAGVVDDGVSSIKQARGDAQAIVEEFSHHLSQQGFCDEIRFGTNESTKSAVCNEPRADAHVGAAAPALLSNDTSKKEQKPEPTSKTEPFRDAASEAINVQTHAVCGEALGDAASNDARVKALSEVAMPTSATSEKKTRSMTEPLGDRPSGGRAPGSQRLEVSATSWVAQQRARRRGMTAGVARDEAEVSPEEVGAMMCSILNKLTTERFELLCAQVLQLPMKTQEQLAAVVAQIFERATTEKGFIGIYAELCTRMDSHLALADGNVNGKAFRRALVTECQLSFERHLKPVEAPAQPDLSYEDRYEEEARLKTRMLGNMRFVGELLVRRLLAGKVLIAICDELLAAGGPAELESLAALLAVVGPRFEQAHSVYAGALKETFGILRKRMKDTSQPMRIRCLLQDLLEARARGWAPKETVEAK